MEPHTGKMAIGGVASCTANEWETILAVEKVVGVVEVVDFTVH